MEVPVPNFNGDRPSMALDSSALTPGRVVVAYDGKTNTMMALTVLKMPRLVEDVVYGRSWVVDAHNHAGGTSPRRLVDLGVPHEEGDEWNSDCFTVGNEYYQEIRRLIAKVKRERSNQPSLRVS